MTETLETIRRTVMRAPPNGRQGEIAKTIQARYVFALMELSASDASPAVKSRTDRMLQRLQSDLQVNGSDYGSWLINRIDAHFENPSAEIDAKAKAKPLPTRQPHWINIKA